MKSKTILFGALRQFLGKLGFREKRAETAWVFKHSTEGLLVFKAYGDDEAVGKRDLISTRRFLDWRGVLEATEFDAAIRGVSGCVP